MANTAKFIRLKKNINKELQEIERLKDEKDNQPFDSAHPRVLASILHDFYTGMERVFLRITKEIDGELPQGEDWHKEMLINMSLDLEEIRPRVISQALAEKLEEYLRFRHLFRNIYGFVIEKERIKPLWDDFVEVHFTFRKSIKEFEKFLDKLTRS